MISWLWLIPAFGLGVVIGGLIMTWCMVDLTLKIADARDRGFRLRR